VKFLFDHDVPDDMAFALTALGHDVLRLREVLPMTTSDEEIFQFAVKQELILISCNRDDFLNAAQKMVHAGLIILIRRRSRALERAALVRLLDQAGEAGIKGNINFA
jgi:predicted nuclease of predicted toxin-antitoxin system